MRIMLSFCFNLPWNLWRTRRENLKIENTVFSWHFPTTSVYSFVRLITFVRWKSSGRKLNLLQGRKLGYYRARFLQQNINICWFLTTLTSAFRANRNKLEDNAETSWENTENCKKQSLRYLSKHFSFLICE